MRRQLLKLLALGNLLLFPACEEDTHNGVDETLFTDYPTIIYPLPLDSLESLEDEFVTLNNNRICVTLGEYGFTANGPCQKPNPRIRINSVDSLIVMAKTIMLLNEKFTNVTDTSALKAGKVTAIPFSDSTHWAIWFENQTYSDHSVLHTDIFIWMYGTGIYRINGHWYRDIMIPHEDKYSIGQASESIIGLEITWHSKTGEPVVFTVTEGSFIGGTEKVIVPLQNEDSIELRVAWQIGVGWEEDSFPAWYVYVDRMTSEVVEIIQLFVT